MNASVTLLRRVLPTSVTLKVNVPETHPSAQILGAERMGSGTLIENGHILTVNYVVLGAESIEVTYLDGTTAEGKVVAKDFYSGLAVVTTGNANGAHAKPGFELVSGDEVFILGSVGGTERRVNSGAVSSLEPFDAFWEFHLDRAILTTAMNPSLGGGGLFNSQGSLTGVVSLDFNEVGRFTLAIPVEHFFHHHEELLKHGRRVSRPPRAWVGFYCYVLREHVIVAGVVPGAPAEQSGLQAGDVVVSLDGARIGDRSMLYQKIWEHAPGDLLTFRVFRGSAVQEVEIRTTDVESFFA
jgi:S1-C subfamily serine protease